MLPSYVTLEMNFNKKNMCNLEFSSARRCRLRRLEEASLVEYNSSNGHCTNHTGISGLATRLPVTPKKIRH